MSVEHVEVLVEEPSMEAALRELLPKMLGELSFRIYPHQCKDELLKRLPDRLRGYAKWLPDTWRVLVIVDRDDDDCVALKTSLEQIARNAGLNLRPGTKARHRNVINRLAIEELEAWFFGDWVAVKQAFPRVPENVHAKSKYSDPDAIKGGTWEAFERVLQKAGYFRGGLRKIEAARSVAVHMDPTRNRSGSFQSLYAVLGEIIA